ncbi:uncharacterized protein LOC120683081 [Panicum virgatum]|uniref:uncharacterized protein LOC120683081 n=1 Tax=Panicum virgatum TaxID=38727 RepID=UPI0019D5D0A2|nr:uncharacterized protein LOC120683081 [Panicum virgatum]
MSRSGQLIAHAPSSENPLIGYNAPSLEHILAGRKRKPSSTKVVTRKSPVQGSSSQQALLSATSSSAQVADTTIVDVPDTPPAGEHAEDTPIGDQTGRTDSQDDSPQSSPSARIKTLSPALKKARTTASSSQVLAGTSSQSTPSHGTSDAGAAASLQMATLLPPPSSNFDEMNLKQIKILFQPIS